MSKALIWRASRHRCIARVGLMDALSGAGRGRVSSGPASLSRRPSVAGGAESSAAPQVRAQPPNPPWIRAAQGEQPGVFSERTLICEGHGIDNASHGPLSALQPNGRTHIQARGSGATATCAKTPLRNVTNIKGLVWSQPPPASGPERKSPSTRAVATLTSF